LRTKFLEHMDDDFNTGGAVGVLFELLSALNRFADSSGLETSKGSAESMAAFQHGVAYLRELAQLLGVFSAPVETAKTDDASQQFVGELIQLLIDLRAEARKAKNFALGDQIRK